MLLRDVKKAMAAFKRSARSSSGSSSKRCTRSNAKDEGTSSGPLERTLPQWPSFTKVITGKTTHHSASCCRLALPRKFCDEHHIQDHVTMTDSTEHRVWHMRLQVRRSQANFVISNGWREFSYDHSLELGTALVFTALSSSHIRVGFASSSGFGARAMHPTRDGREYPWRTNYSRLACLAWGDTLSNLHTFKDPSVHDAEQEESMEAGSANERILQDEIAVLSSEGRLRIVENAAFVQNVASSSLPEKLNFSDPADLPKEQSLQEGLGQTLGDSPSEEELNPQDPANLPEEKMQFCQCKPRMTWKLQEFIYLKCTNPDGSAYLQIIDSDSEDWD